MGGMDEQYAPADARPAPLDGQNSASSSQTAEPADQQRQDTPGTSSHVLPRGSRVRVVGNARTKSTLVGMEGVVRKSVGLGGWHWLVLSNGEDIKLQRNALTVLEFGPDDQESDADDNSGCQNVQLEILNRPRIRRPPRALSPVAEIRKKHPLVVRPSMFSHVAPGVNLHRLHPSSLQRYQNKYKLGNPDALQPREDMVYCVTEHFKSQSVDEEDVLFSFVAAVRRDSEAFAQPMMGAM